MVDHESRIHDRRSHCVNDFPFDLFLKKHNKLEWTSHQRYSNGAIIIELVMLLLRLFCAIYGVLCVTCIETSYGSYGVLRI